MLPGHFINFKKTFLRLQMTVCFRKGPLALDVLSCPSQAASKQNGKDNAKSQRIIMMMTTTLAKPHFRGLHHSTIFCHWLESLFQHGLTTAYQNNHGVLQTTKVIIMIGHFLIQMTKLQINLDSNPMSRFGSWMERHCTREGRKGWTDSEHTLQTATTFE